MSLGSAVVVLFMFCYLPFAEVWADDSAPDRQATHALLPAETATPVCEKVAREFPSLVPLLDLEQSGQPSVIEGSFIVDCASYIPMGLSKATQDITETGSALYGLVIKRPYIVLKQWLTGSKPEPSQEVEHQSPSVSRNTAKQGLQILWCLKPDVRLKYLCMETVRQAALSLSGVGIVRAAGLLSREQKLLNSVLVETSPAAKARIDKIKNPRKDVVNQADQPIGTPKTVESLQLNKNVAPSTPVAYRPPPEVSGLKEYKPFYSASGSQNGGLATANLQGKEVFLKHPVEGSSIYSRIFDREATNAFHASNAQVGPKFYGTTTVGGKKALVMEKLDGELIHDFNVSKEFATTIKQAKPNELAAISGRLKEFERYIDNHGISAIDFQVMLTKDKKLYIIDTAHFIPGHPSDKPLLLKKMKELVDQQMKSSP